MLPSALPWSSRFTLLLAFGIAAVVNADCDPRIGFFSLPTILYDGQLYLAHGGNPQAFCRLKGFSTSALTDIRPMRVGYPFPDAAIKTINPDTWAVCDPAKRSFKRECSYLGIVECLPEGVSKCESWDTIIEDTIGTGNEGSANWGNNNFGQENHGNGNRGDGNVGNNNVGDNIVCNNKRDASPCLLSDLLTSETVVVHPGPSPPPVVPPPPQPEPPSPPPGEGGCDPSIAFFGLPTVEYMNSLYLLNPEGGEAFCQQKGFGGGGIVPHIFNVFDRSPFLILHIATINPSNMETCLPTSTTSCQAASVIQCVPSGVPLCQPNLDGNVGTGNVGSGNYGNNNIGSNNYGSYNQGLGNTGSWNRGTQLTCNYANTKTRACPIWILKLSETLLIDPSQPRSPPL
uniref:Uncharacterized protein n=2 Tax=Auxenochlorella protothecoides TaxID=3075 RepID=A0A1D1ZPG9_AUXPR